MILKDIAVVLVGVEGSINLGQVARLCKNFGVNKLYLVNPQTAINEEAYRYAMRGREILDKAIVVNSLEEISREYEVLACTSAVVPIDKDPLRQPIELGEFVDLMNRYDRVAVVFGRESTGLTRDELRECDLYIHIEADQEYPVLNLSHAVAIVLYEIHKRYSKQHSLDTLEKPDPSDIELLERFFKKAIEKTYSNSRREDIEAAIKRIIHKMLLTKTEARILIRILSKLLVLADEKCSQRTRA